MSPHIRSYECRTISRARHRIKSMQERNPVRGSLQAGGLSFPEVQTGHSGFVRVCKRRASSCKRRIAYSSGVDPLSTVFRFRHSGCSTLPCLPSRTARPILCLRLHFLTFGELPSLLSEVRVSHSVFIQRRVMRVLGLVLNIDKMDLPGRLTACDSCRSMNRGTPQNEPLHFKEAWGEC